MPDRYAQPRRQPRGFTLTEMLVILGVIIIILAIALPAFNAAQGSRSVEAGQNIVSASLGRARAEAVRRGVTCGAYFFVDGEGRTSVAFVAVGNASSDPDPYDEYKPFDNTADYQGATTDPIGGTRSEAVMTADRVIALASDGNETDYDGNYAGYLGRPIVATFEPRSFGQSVTSPGIEGTGGFVPPTEPDSGTTAEISTGTFRSDGGDGNRSNDSYTTANSNSELILLTDIPIEVLPAGVGMQIITGAALEQGTDGTTQDVQGAIPNPPASEPFIERYTRAGLIAFDRTGRLVQVDYIVTAGSKLSFAMGLDQVFADANGGPPESSILRANTASVFNGLGPNVLVAGMLDPSLRPGMTSLQSGFGVVVYRNDEFESAAADGTAQNWKGSFFRSVDAEDAILDFVTSDADIIPSYPNYDQTEDHWTQLGGPIFNEYAEERWLDANTEPLLVNRFSGTLVSNSGDQAD